MSCKKWAVTGLIVATAGVVPQPAEAQFRKGFAKQTFDVTLNRKRAPKVYLMGTTIRVDASAATPALTDAAKQVAVMLEAELPSHDSRLTPVKDRPETIITVSLVQVDSSRATEMREVLVSKQTGTRNGKPVYSMVKENRMFVVVTGRVSATFQVRDAIKNTVLDADTVSPVYKRDFVNGAGAPAPAEVQLDLLRLVANEIVPRIAPTIEPVKVLLARPSDEIDDLNKLGEKNLWSLMLEKLELVKPLGDKKKEAYRLYNLGVANEALAYAAGDIATSKRLLEQASSYYSKAIEANDDEKYFQEPQTRIAEALNGYTTLETQMKQYEEMRVAAVAAAEAAARATATNSRALPAAPAATGVAGSTFTNASVINMVAKGLDEANTIDFVKGAESVAFDLTPAGIQSLLEAKVTNPIIRAMRARQAAKPAATPQRPPSRANTGATAKPSAETTQKPAAPKPATAAPKPPSTAKPATR